MISESKAGGALLERTARSAELDTATGMYYYGARYYDPRLSIFISVDPLVEQTMTPYRYAFNNPIMFTDPTGLFETKFGAWWHKQWNGKDTSSEIKFNDKLKYYYTNSSSYTDDDGNEGMVIDIVSKSQKGDAGRFVFEVEAKASVGVQLDLAVPFGNVEAGVVTADIGSVGYSNQNPNASTAKWGDGTGHNFIGGSLNVPFLKQVGVSGKADYVTKDMIPHGQLLDYYPNNGSVQTEWGVGPSRSVKMAKMPQFTNKTSLGGGDIGAKVGTPAGTNNHVLDISGGVKAIFGIEGSLKIGVTGRKR